MDCRERQQDGLTVLSVSGEIDLQNSPVLREVLQRKLKAKCPELVLDLSGVEYIDSSGLATLVEYTRDSQAFKGKFALAGLQERVRAIIELVRLNELFVIVPTVDEASKAFAG